MTSSKRMSDSPNNIANNDDATVLEKYRQVYRKYLDDKIIDMDKRMKHPFDFQIYPLETAIPYVNYLQLIKLKVADPIGLAAICKLNFRFLLKV